MSVTFKKKSFALAFIKKKKIKIHLSNKTIKTYISKINNL